MREAFRSLCWIVVGDFNISLYPSEKRGGVEGFFDGMQDFVDFVHNNELMDVELKKFRLTWTNGRCRAAHIQAKLDRVLISQDCLD